MHPITPEQIEEAARCSGKSMNRVCQDAAVPRSAFTRWKNGSSSPTLDTVNRLIAATQVLRAAD